MERTQIYLTKSQIKKLRKTAQKKNATLSSMVREAINVQYGSQIRILPKEKVESFSEFAKRIRRMGFKGPKDLATNLDKYLYGGKK